MRGAYYNEHDAKAAAWLRHLIEEGVIAHGIVDERSIQEVDPAELRDFAQCHFFAGIGVWSYALRRAGWPDDRSVWTGSCPCQPFSTAGKQQGFDDPRHLWPTWFRLIRERRPDVLFGEQVDDADAWIDLVATDLEGLGYAVGSPDLPAAGFGGAHIRQRFYWVADANNAEWWSERAPWHDGCWPKARRIEGPGDAGFGLAAGRVADADFAGLGGLEGVRLQRPYLHDVDRRDTHGGLGDPCGPGPTTLSGDPGEVRSLPEAERQPEHRAAVPWRSGALGGVAFAQHGRREGGRSEWRWAGPALPSGPADWLLCRDGLWRPVEPGSFPLDDEAPARVGRLRGYGNALDAETAAEFIAAYLDAAPSRMEAA